MPMPLVDQHGNPLSSRPTPPGGYDVKPPPQGLPGLHRPDGGKAWATSDSYQNFMASVGFGTPNLQSGSSYSFNPITRERTLLEWMYRSSWVCGVAIDAVADDMVKMGIDFSGQMQPKDQEKLQRHFRDFGVWEQLNLLIKWGRLYGGAIAAINIAGQDPKTPLRLETVGKGSYRGLTVMDRWMVEPSLSDLVTEDESRTERGLPRYYRVTADAPAFPMQTIHYSRIFRYEGYDLPYWQKISENLWGMAVYERLYDRLIAFDSATQGVAQLIYKAYLRWVKVKGLRMMITTGGQDMQRLLNHINMIRWAQTNEGITLLDSDDDFGTTTYAFGGLDEALLQFGQQLSGALGIPLVRLFGQSPAGLNSTGESDLRTYYDSIHQNQELRLTRPIETVAKVIARSEGIDLPEADELFTFLPLWQMLPKEKSEISEITSRNVLSAFEIGVVTKARALEELRQSSQLTGIWNTISDEEIEQAQQEDMLQKQMELEQQQMQHEMAMNPPEPGEEGGQPGQPGQPREPDVHVHVGGRGGGANAGAVPGAGNVTPIAGAHSAGRMPVPIPRPTMGRGTPV
jgi:phage-related protein (TIGR01555 family)